MPGGDPFLKRRFELPATIASGKRNATIFQYACSLQARGVPDAELAGMVREANSERCSPPMDDAEVEGIIESATRYEKGEPRSIERAVAEGASEREPLREFVFDDTPPNDMTLSRLFAAVYGERVVYCVEMKRFYYYNGTRWVDDPEGAKVGAACTAMVRGLLLEAVDRIRESVLAKRGEDEARAYFKSLTRYEAYKARRDVLADARSRLTVRFERFDRDANLVNFRNGTMDLRTMTLRAHDPADMITKVCGAPYDDRADCTEWLEFLSGLFEGDADVIAYVQKQMGMALAGDTSQERMHILYGRPRSGKSTFGEALKRAFGTYAQSVNPETFAVKPNAKGGDATPELAKLAGVRLALAPEPPKSLNMDVALIKRLTGNDTISARGLYRDFIEFEPRFSLWWNTNYLPNVADITLFGGDRCMVVKTRDTIPQGKRDLALKDRLFAPEHLSAILLWCVGGLKLYRAEGAELPEAVVAATGAYRLKSDLTAQFLAERMVADEGAVTKAADVYAAYCAWCTADNHGFISKSSFYQDLRDRGLYRDQMKLRGDRYRSVVAGYRFPNGH